MRKKTFASITIKANHKKYEICSFVCFYRKIEKDLQILVEYILQNTCSTSPIRL